MGRLDRRVVAGVISLVGLVLLLLWMQGVIGSGKIQPGLLAEEMPPSKLFETLSVERRPVGGFREIVGTVSSKKTVSLSSKIAARILSIGPRSGDRVREGETLAVLDNRELSARLAQAEAELQAAAAQRANAAADYERSVRLLKAGVISEQAYEQAESVKLSADARVSAGLERVREAKLQLGEATLVSPLNGVVVERAAEPGDLATPGKPLLQLEDPAQIRLEAAVPEADVQALSIGETLPIRVDSLQLDLTGKIEEIVPVADPTNRSFLIRLTLPLKPGLKSGMFGRLRLPKSQESLLLIPRKAVRQVGQVETVRILEDGKVRVRQIQSGRAYGEEVEVLSGLSEGARLIVGGGQ